MPCLIEKLQKMEIKMENGRLKDLLEKNSILVAPAAFDMVSAKIIEKAGFEAVYLSGFGQSASHLGLPDAGLMTFTEIEGATIW